MIDRPDGAKTEKCISHSPFIFITGTNGSTLMWKPKSFLSEARNSSHLHVALEFLFMREYKFSIITLRQNGSRTSGRRSRRGVCARF